LVFAKSVRLMYSALIFAANALAVVVFPVHGVPVMRMTRLFMYRMVFKESFIRSAN